MSGSLFLDDSLPKSPFKQAIADANPDAYSSR